MQSKDIISADLDIQIRPMQQEDQQGVLELIRHSVFVLNAVDYSQEDIELIVEGYTLQEFSKWKIAYVALHKDRIIGVIGGYRVDSFFVEIQGLFVHPNYIRRKIGSKLLNKLEKTSLAQEGVMGVLVNSSITARDFYLAHKYEITGHKEKSSVVKSVHTITFLKTIFMGNLIVTTINFLFYLLPLVAILLLLVLLI